MEVKIYCLYEPHTCKIRYIGRTKSLLQKRLQQHICKAKKNYLNSYKENWIRSLLKNGIKPGIRLLTTVEGWEKSHTFEKEVIQKHLLRHNLVNGDDRGPGKLSKNISSDIEKIRREKIKNFFNKEENKINFYTKIYAYREDGTFYKEFLSRKFIVEEIGISENSLTNHVNRFDNYHLKVNPIKGYFFSKNKYEKFPLTKSVYQSNYREVKVFKEGILVWSFPTIEAFCKHFSLGTWDISEYKKGKVTKKFKELLKTFSISPL